MPDGSESAQFLDLALTTLRSIGDAVIATDAQGRVTFLNPVAERLTGWPHDEAIGKDSKAIFRIVNEETRREVQSPIDRVIAEGTVVGLANHTVLLSRDGREVPIDDSGAPVRDAAGNLFGVVLVFRDVTERKEAELRERAAREYAENIVETVREPLVILGPNLRVKTANRAFYRTFHVNPDETEGQFLFDLGNGQWNIPALRVLLEEVLPENSHFDDFEVEHDFKTIGRKFMLLNARRLYMEGNHSELILLAIEDITERKRAAEVLEISEIRYRRLFEAARDGILILNAETTRITDSNPFMSELLGFTREELEGRELADIGLFQDREAAFRAMEVLQRIGYVRYEDLPLQTKARQHRDVEVVSNVYAEDGRRVIQCNIRDVTERKRAEDAMARHQAEIVLLNERLRQAMTETHHRVKNNLQILAGMVDMSLRGGTKTVTASELKRIASGIKALSAVHDILTQQAKLDGEANWLSTKALIEKLLALIQMTASHVRLRYDVSEGQISTKKGAALALVTNELVSNAMKHGANTVDVAYTVNHGGAVLRVCDDGPGFPATFAPAKASSTGLELVLNLARWDLGGEVSFENRAEGGACVTLTIP